MDFSLRGRNARSDISDALQKGIDEHRPVPFFLHVILFAVLVKVLPVILIFLEKSSRKNHTLSGNFKSNVKSDVIE